MWMYPTLHVPHQHSMYVHGMRLVCMVQLCSRAANAAATPLSMRASLFKHHGQSFTVRIEKLALCVCRAVYELSAVVWHIQDADEEEEGSAQQEGHLVAHIKVSSYTYALTLIQRHQSCSYHHQHDMHGDTSTLACSVSQLAGLLAGACQLHEPTVWLPALPNRGRVSWTISFGVAWRPQSSSPCSLCSSTPTAKGGACSAHPASISQQPLMTCAGSQACIICTQHIRPLAELLVKRQESLCRTLGWTLEPPRPCRTMASLHSWVSRPARAELGSADAVHAMPRL